MNDSTEQQATVQYFVHEGMIERMKQMHEAAMGRMERIFRITVIALVAALVAALMALLINDARWRSYCDAIEDKYHVEATPTVHEQPNQTPD